MKNIAFFALLLLGMGCKTIPETTPKKMRGLRATQAMVVSARSEASTIGIGILRSGGNAFDAMIATEMALAVSYPYAGNLGGGGFMVYRKADGTKGALDFREKAPLAATKDMFLDETGAVIPMKSQEGGLAVGVPGTIAGIFAVHKKLGSLPMAQLLQPAIDLAKNGYVVTSKQEQRLQKYRKLFSQNNADTILYARPYMAGDTIKNEALSQTLARIAKYGKDEFYKGATAQKLIRFLQQKEGIMTLEDLENYEAKWRTPVQFPYKDLRITSMSPPSSGGLCLGQMMTMVAPYPIAEYGYMSTKSIQIQVEAARRAYADRSYYLGDPDFVTIPTDSLLSSAYLTRRMQDFSFDKATPSSTIQEGHLQGYEHQETTHYSIVDSLGNALAVTTTLNGAYGSKMYVSELGFFLNNEMDDFSAKPGAPNMFGLIGADANAIAPQKRMLSSMTPTLIEKDNKLWMVLGTPGGSSIITAVLQTILNVYEHNMTMQQAVDAPRFHHQWIPETVFFEPNYHHPDLFQKLHAKGYPIRQKELVITSKVDAILVLPDGSLEAGADHRGDDTAMGY